MSDVVNMIKQKCIEQKDVKFNSTSDMPIKFMYLKK